jgi:hypothetical protein
VTSSIGSYIQPLNNLISGQQVSAVQFVNPSLGIPTAQYQPVRGICTLYAPSVGTLQFRTNPNSISWDYSLITNVQQTYGGRVIQILGARIDNLEVKVDCGQGGWDYAAYVAQFMRDMMMTQRNGIPGTFIYTTRNWNLSVYALNVPFHDAVEETVRELTLQFKVQQDVSKVAIASQSIANLLGLLQQGMGFLSSEAFSNPVAGTNVNNANQTNMAGLLSGSPLVTPATAATAPPNTGIPGLSDILAGSGLGGIAGLF